MERCTSTPEYASNPTPTETSPTRQVIEVKGDPETGWERHLPPQQRSLRAKEVQGGHHPGPAAVGQEQVGMEEIGPGSD
jgi:hypothetical protein